MIANPEVEDLQGLEPVAMNKSDAQPQAPAPPPSPDVTLKETYPCRALFGFLPPAQRLPLLLGRGVVPGEDVTEPEQSIRRMTEAVSQRPVHSWESPEVALLLELAERITGAPLVAANMGGLCWHPGAVDLSKVGAFQSLINLHGLDEESKACPTIWEPFSLSLFRPSGIRSRFPCPASRVNTPTP
jgi:hypothetical protein